LQTTSYINVDTTAYVNEDGEDDIEDYCFWFKLGKGDEKRKFLVKIDTEQLKSRRYFRKWNREYRRKMKYG
jgi:hypothetical protein